MVRRAFSTTFPVLVALLAGPGASGGQEPGVIAGQVINSATNEALPGAQVYLEGSTIGGLADAEGQFRLEGVPAGRHRVRAELIGFGPLTLDVDVLPGGAARIAFQMRQTAIALDALVITVTGPQRKRELGTVVGTVNAEQRTQVAPITNPYDLLQAQTPGVQVLNAGGAPGQGSRIRIRGSNSISLVNEPIVYLDGIQVASWSGLSMNVGGSDLGRLNEINPDDIESIEILKGPSAAALYGTEAANGVVRITTKKGRTGPPTWTFYSEGGLIHDPFTYPDNWDARGTSGELCSLYARGAGQCPAVAEVHRYQVLEDSRFSPYQTGYRQQYGLNISGGSGRVNYYVSTNWENEVGPYELPGYYRRELTEAGFQVDETTERPQQVTRVHVRTNVSAQVSETATLNLSTGYMTSDRSFTHNDNSIFGPLVSGLLGGAHRPGADEGDEGAWRIFDPGQIFHTTLRQEVNRFTSSGNARWGPVDWLEVRGALGVDFWSGEDTSQFPRGLTPFFPTGSRSANRTQDLRHTADAGATATFQLSPSMESRTSAGVQYTRKYFSGTFTQGWDLAIGSTSLTSAATTSADEGTMEARTLGGYVEQTVSFNDRLFLSAGLRRDANSAFGKGYRAAFYPKLSASWLVSEEGWFPRPGWLDELRVRAAWGKSGLQPDLMAALRTLQALAFTHPVTGASASGVTVGNIGNPELGPESSAEYETGLELGLLGGRAGLELTYYDKRTEDALIRRDLPPSLGVGQTRWENLGSVRNRGFEASLEVALLQASHWSWDVTMAGSVNDNAVLDLGPGVEPIGSDLRFVEGFPAGGYWQRPYSWEDANGDGMISTQELQVGDTAVFVNRTFPGREMSLHTSFRVLDAITLSGLLDYRGDFVVWNRTEGGRCNRVRPVCAGVMNPDVPLWEQARAVALSQHNSQTAYGFLEDGSFWKLRELALSWELSDGWSSAWGASRTALTVAGRNLATWTDYSGLDPEVSGDGGSSNFQTRDFFTQPPLRYWTARVTVSF